MMRRHAGEAFFSISREQRMGGLDRELEGDALLLHHPVEEKVTTDAELLERNGRNGRTLVKSGALRVTMIVLAAGGNIPEHHAEGPITVQVLTGSMRFTVAGRGYDLAQGDLLSVGAGIRHDVASKDGATFLLTIAAGKKSTDPG
jgi:quercetin dioxygenase-like cupin family protein